jgi:Na+/H+ antiporter NhaD/arsenite permease-like protein
VTGNPQNMLIGIDSRIPFATFSAAMAVPVLGALGLDGLLISLVWRRALAPRLLAAGLVPAETFDRVLCAKALLALAVTFVLFVVEFEFYPQAALIGASLCLSTGRVPARDVWRRVDWSLLLFFAGLFVVMGGFQRAGYLDDLMASVRPVLAGDGGQGHGLGTFLALSGLAAVLSNLVSNVPAVVLLEPLVRDLGSGRGLWLCLALSSTLAGNFTLIASVANLIVAEKAAADGERLPFFSYLAIGLPISLVTVALGTAWVWATTGR